MSIARNRLTATRRGVLRGAALTLALAGLPGLALAEDTAAVLPERAQGDADAPVTIVEFASFTCPACATFHNEVMADLRERYIEPGDVRIVYRDYPLDAAALAASVVARCAPEAQFFRFVDAFYRSQPQWSRAAGGAEARAELAELGLLDAWAAADFPEDIGRAFAEAAGPIQALLRNARLGGLQPARAAECLGDPALIEALLLQQWEDQQAYAVRATPSFLIDGQLHSGVLRIEELSAILDPLLGRS
jgi:protein-disulfide isomerase